MQLQAEMTSAEFNEWMAYYELEPFGELIADMRFGESAALLANINRDREKRSDPYRAEDFVHWRDADQTAAEDEPILLDDPVAQSNLIRAAMFGIAPVL